MKHKEFDRIFITEDYDIFQHIDGNRDINPLHLQRIKDSINKKELISLVTVNEDMGVIDGQHTLEARKSLGKPVYYMIRPGYGREEVNILNANRRNWAPDDFIEAYCELGNKDYKIFKDFKDTYGFGYQDCMMLLGKELNGRGNGKIFQNGEFKVERYGEAIKIANRIYDIKPFYEGFKRRGFIRAMTKLVRNPLYNHKELLEKLELQPTAIKDCINSEEYMKVLENIYNWKRRDKVRLF